MLFVCFLSLAVGLSDVSAGNIHSVPHLYNNSILFLSVLSTSLLLISEIKYIHTYLHAHIHTPIRMFRVKWRRRWSISKSSFSRQCV